MRSIFGWSYPPGCSGPPDEYEGPCEVCGQHVDDCICPECEVCATYGDPDCYIKHGLRRTEEQKFLKEISDRAQREAYRMETLYDRLERRKTPWEKYRTRA